MSLQVNISNRSIFRRRRDGQVEPGTTGAGSVTSSAPSGLSSEIFWNYFELKNSGESNEYLRLKRALACDYSIQLYSDFGQFPPSIWDEMPIATAEVHGSIKYDDALFEVNLAGQLTIKAGVITPGDHDHDDRYMTDAEVGTAIGNALAALVDSAPGTLDTLNELAAALGDDPNFASTITGLIAAKLDASAYTASDVLAKILSLDGAGSGIDADLLDGQHGSYYAPVANPTLTGVASISSNGGLLNLIGTDHCYVQLFPDGTAAGRKAYLGFAAGADDNISIANEIATGKIRLIPGTNGSTEHCFGSSVKLETTSTGIKVSGENHIAGVGNCLYFDTTGVAKTAWARVINNYDLELTTQRGTTSKVVISSGGQVELYYGANKKIETSSDGAIISGSLIATAVGSPSSTDFITKRAGTTISKVTSDNKVHFKDTIILYSDQV